MNPFRMLQQRAVDHKPLGAGLIGAGKVGDINARIFNSSLENTKPAIWTAAVATGVTRAPADWACRWAWRTESSPGIGSPPTGRS